MVKESSSKIRVTLVKSGCGHTDRQTSTLLGLGLKKTGSTSVLADTASTRGMIRKVSHLVSVEKV
ncbi:MAG: 50S ribosomal protein L30 [Deltaproteobacteria bacterium]|nr:50S ribosomal protein L30 [Deltaproteobacteria bacterium]